MHTWRKVSCCLVAAVAAMTALSESVDGLAVEPTIIEAESQSDLIASSPELLNVPATGYRGIWYYNQKLDDEYVYKYSGGFGAYCAGHVPMAIYAPEVNKTFFTFGGTTPNNLTLLQCVSSFDHTTKTLGTPTVVYDKHTTDANDNAVLGLDGDGYLYLFSASHGPARQSAIARSKRPYDCTEFETVYTGNFSYPQPYFVPSKGKFLFIHTVCQDSTDQGANCIAYFDPSTCQMSDSQELCFINDGDYLRSWQSADGRIGIAFDQHPTDKPDTGLNYRTDLFYMETRDGGETWVTADGTALTLPITSRDTPARVFSYADKNLNVYIKGVAYDSANRPYVLYIVSKGDQPGPDNDPRQWKVAHFDGEQWTECDTGITSDSNYDFGQLEVLANGDLRIIGATERGPQPYNPGGEIAAWVSQDGGTTWTKTKNLTSGSVRNQNYPRRVLGGAHSGFLTFWADGDGRKPSVSRLSYCDENLNAFPMPLEIGDAPQTELPSGYDRLACITGQGGQYINTEFTPLCTDSVEMKIVLMWRLSTECIFCARDKDAKGTYSLFSWSLQQVARCDFNDGGQFGAELFPVKKPCTFVVDGNARRFAKNGVEYKLQEIQPGSSGTYTVASRLFFFASHKAEAESTLGNYGTFEMYGAVIRDRLGNVKRNYVPCMRQSDGAVGLYETIEGRFLGNSGSGKFMFRTDVVYVDANASPDNQPPYNSPDNAANSIEKGIANVKSGGKVILAPKQTWSLDTDLSCDVSLVGPNDRSTVITGAGVSVNANQVLENLTFVNDIVTVKAGGVISNCVVRGGSGSGAHGLALGIEGGMAVDTTIEEFNGVGVLMLRDSVSTTACPTLVRCVVRNARREGDPDEAHYAIVSIGKQAQAVLRDCVITNNVNRSMFGGAIGYVYVTGGGPIPNFKLDYNYDLVLDRCVIADNQGRFGALRLSSSTSPAQDVALPHVYATNCLFASNKSINRGNQTANRTFLGRGEFVNCTITGNRPATVSGSKLLFNMVNTTDCPNAKACNFVNTVISDNDNATTYDTSGGRGPISARNCIFPEAGDAAYTGKGDLVGPAIFRGTGTTPYALKKNSSGYGTGDASIWTKDDVDLEGKTRLNRNGSVDMGCYRSHLDLGLLLFVM